MEDCIQFSPELFRVQKSIVVAEPIISFTETIKMQLATQGRHMESARSGNSSTSEYMRTKLQHFETGRAQTMKHQSSNVSGSMRTAS